MKMYFLNKIVFHILKIFLDLKYSKHFKYKHCYVNLTIQILAFFPVFSRIYCKTI